MPALCAGAIAVGGGQIDGQDENGGNVVCVGCHASFAEYLCNSEVWTPRHVALCVTLVGENGLGPSGRHANERARV